ncbi:MAG: PilZ domain-containing protein [Phycisphaerae bacterium]
MFDDMEPSAGLFSDDEAFGLLQELAANTPDELRRKRAHFRLSIKIGVILQPGNASEMLKLKLKGVTGDISEGGCSAVFPVPIRVGDIYRLQFDRERLDLPLTFARCVRCRLIREDAYEAGFAVFTNICLPENVSAGEESNLVS